MPGYRSITLGVISQYDCLQLPEYPPRTPPEDPFTSRPTLISSTEALVSVYIPSYPGSNFWLSYSISAPHPPKALYYFKLLINGDHIASWGCGEQEGFAGKTMFGLYRGVEGGIERRAFSFAEEDGPGKGPHGEMMEVKVYRATGRRKTIPEIDCLESGSSGAGPGTRPGEIRLFNAGILQHRHPKRYYQYALLDALDKPFACFRYYTCSWDELDRLSITSSPSDTSTAFTDCPSPSKYPSTRPALDHRSSTDSILSLTAHYTPPHEIREAPLHPPPSPPFNSPLRLPPISLPRPPSPPSSLPLSPTKSMPGSYPGEYPLINNRSATNINRALLSMSISSPRHEDDLIRSSQENVRQSFESNRKTDFGGLVAQLMRRSPSPVRGRRAGNCGSASGGETSPSTSYRRRLGRRTPSPRTGQAWFNADTTDDEEEERDNDETPRRVRKMNSLRVLKDALDSAVRRRGRSED
ncbi:hypothetical protein MMC17_000998 [Xylographa soralifera]|nr:hypothetical protein [Xylographa soralifera]